MSGAIACPSCGSGNFPTASKCWLCQYPLSAAAGAQAAAAQAAAAAGDPPAKGDGVPDGAPVETPPVVPVNVPSAFDGLGWMLAFVVALFLMISVGVELAMLWPGLLIPYAVLALPVIAVAGRIAWVQRVDFWNAEKRAAAGLAEAPVLDARGDPIPGASAGGSSDVAGQVLSAVAMGMVGLIVVVSLVMLLLLAAFVILFAICFAMIFAMEGGSL